MFLWVSLDELRGGIDVHLVPGFVIPIFSGRGGLGTSAAIAGDGHRHRTIDLFTLASLLLEGERGGLFFFLCRRGIYYCSSNDDVWRSSVYRLWVWFIAPPLLLISFVIVLFIFILLKI